MSTTSSLPGMLHAAFVRSPHAHARIRGIDKSAALALPGVHAVLTLADLPESLRQQTLPLLVPSPAIKQIFMPHVPRERRGRAMSASRSRSSWPTAAISPRMRRDWSTSITRRCRRRPIAARRIAARRAAARMRSAVQHRGASFRSASATPTRPSPGRACLPRKDLPASRRRRSSWNAAAWSLRPIGSTDALTHLCRPRRGRTGTSACCSICSTGRDISCASSRPMSAAASVRRALLSGIWRDRRCRDVAAAGR